MNAVGSSQVNPGIERFNTVVLEFFTKLQRVSTFGPTSIDRMDKIIALAKQESPLPLNIFKSVASKDSYRELIANADVSIFDTLPLVDKADFMKLTEKTKKSSWKYVRKLLKIADESDTAAMDMSSITDMATTALGSLDMETIGETAWSILGSVKKVFKRNNVDEEKFLNITEEIVESLPSVGSIEPKTYAGKAKKLIGDLLFGEDESEQKRKRVKN